MREFSIEDNLKKTLGKLAKKDRAMYEALMKKMEEVLTCEDVEHYKNLRSPLQDFKRVHIKRSFVLIFKHIKPDNKILFYDLDHHDQIYNG